MQQPRFVIAFFAVTLASAGAFAQTMVVQQPPMGMQQQPMMAPPPTVIVQERNCHHYTDNFTIGRETRVTHGMACLQPDGSWALRPSTAAVNYIARGGNIFLVPTQPFAEVAPPPPVTEVIIDHGHPHHPGW